MIAIVGPGYATDPPITYRPDADYTISILGGPDGGDFVRARAGDSPLSHRVLPVSAVWSGQIHTDGVQAIVWGHSGTGTRADSEGTCYGLPAHSEAVLAADDIGYTLFCGSRSLSANFAVNMMGMLEMSHCGFAELSFETKSLYADGGLGTHIEFTTRIPGRLHVRKASGRIGTGDPAGWWTNFDYAVVFMERGWAIVNAASGLWLLGEPSGEAYVWTYAGVECGALDTRCVHNYSGPRSVELPAGTYLFRVWAEYGGTGYVDADSTQPTVGLFSAGPHFELSLEWVQPGDVNGDGVYNFDDIPAFVEALSSGEEEFQAAHPTWVWLAADADGNSLVNFEDIDPFVAGLTSGG